MAESERGEGAILALKDFRQQIDVDSGLTLPFDGVREDASCVPDRVAIAQPNESPIEGKVTPGPDFVRHGDDSHADTPGRIMRGCASLGRRLACFPSHALTWPPRLNRRGNLPSRSRGRSWLWPYKISTARAAL